MKKIIVILLLSLPLPLLGQGGMASIWVETGIPTGDFRRNTDAFGLGFGGGAYFSFDAQNLFYFGADLSYDIYGKSFESDGFYEIVTNNNILQFHGVLRIMPQTAGIRPYIEGLYGLKYLYTNSKLKEDILSTATAIKTDFGDVALSYGGSVGLQFPLGGGVSSIDFRVQYLIGGDANYIDGKTIRDIGIDAAITNPIQSETDMVVIKLGMTFGW